MKKWSLVLFVFSFILLGFNANSANAQSAMVPGCSGTSGFSWMTGQPCSASINLPVGCTSSFGFSAVTGMSCASNSFPAGCTSNSNYNSVTGKLCGTIITPAFPFAGSCAINSILRLGSTGNEVACLQTRLGLSADGIFGSETQTAVVNFQSAKGLVADGIFGSTSIGALSY